MDIEMELNRESTLLTRYLNNMQQIKLRMHSVQEVLMGVRSTSYPATNIEFCSLQIRKILELIVLSSLVSDLDLYEREFKNLDKMWNPRLIIRDIERINPNFYPEPIEIEHGEIDNFKPKTDGFLTKNNLIHAYEKCGKYLHAPSLGISKQQEELMYAEAQTNIVSWSKEIVGLLSVHIVHLHNSRDFYYVVMQAKSDGQPHGNVFTRSE